MREDIYTSTIDNRPAFVKSDLLDTGDQYEGLASERDIDKHRASRKQLAPAFSPRALVQYEPRLNTIVNRFIAKIKAPGAASAGVNMVPVSCA